MGTKLVLGFLLILSPQSWAMDLFSDPHTFEKPAIKKSTADNRRIPQCLNEKQQKAQNFYYCPAPSELYQIKDKWLSPGDWFSYEQSFAKNIDRFIGATWKGVNIGNVICLYKARNATFPVQLTNKQSVFQPIKANWPLYPNKDGSFQCLAINNNPCDCGFSQHHSDETTPEEALTLFMKIPKMNPPPYTSPFYTP
ncbi:MAG TPA: T4SS-associated protein EirA [Gammaproteobacteria bacterium]|nr:T4SS-associated protein EirA [Gammaproteobacteria bacterium]